MKRPLFLLLLVVVLTAQLSCTRVKPPSESVPTASPPPTEEAKIDQILARYEQAIGGKDAIAAITSYKLKGTFQLPGVSGTIEGWRKEPRKTLTIIQFPKIGPVKKGFDGENHWIQTASGIARDSNSQEIAELERDSEVYSAGKIKELFATMKLDNKARLNGRDMHVVEGKPAKGPAEKLFFDVESGLLVRWDMARRDANRTVFVKVHLDDYKDIGGVKIPLTVRFAFESFNFTVKVDEMQHNIPIDDAIFKKP
jgi:hypothetical protein